MTLLHFVFLASLHQVGLAPQGAAYVVAAPDETTAFAAVRKIYHDTCKHGKDSLPPLQDAGECRVFETDPNQFPGTVPFHFCIGLVDRNIKDRDWAVQKAKIELLQRYDIELDEGEVNFYRASVGKKPRRFRDTVTVPVGKSPVGPREIIETAKKSGAFTGFVERFAEHRRKYPSKG